METHTIKEWLETLPEPYRGQALENHANETDPGFTNDFNLHQGNLTIAIGNAFMWEKTPQGLNYWDGVQHMADTGLFRLSPSPIDQSGEEKTATEEFIHLAVKALIDGAYKTACDALEYYYLHILPNQSEETKLIIASGPFPYTSELSKLRSENEKLMTGNNKMRKALDLVLNEPIPPGLINGNVIKRLKNQVDAALSTTTNKG